MSASELRDAVAIPTLGCTGWGGSAGFSRGSSASCPPAVVHPNPAWDSASGGEGERVGGGGDDEGLEKRQAAFTFGRGEQVSAVRGSQEEEIKHLMGHPSSKT